MWETVDIEMHHGGRFDSTPVLTYKGGSVTITKRFDPDWLNITSIRENVKNLGYLNVIGIYFKLGYEGFVALQPLISDTDIIKLLRTIEDGDLVQIFVEHGVDDVQALLPPKALPAPHDVAECEHDNEKEAEVEIEKQAEAESEHLDHDDEEYNFGSDAWTQTPIDDIVGGEVALGEDDEAALGEDQEVVVEDDEVMFGYGEDVMDEDGEQLGHSWNSANNPPEDIQLESTCSDTAKDKIEERTISPSISGKNQTKQATPGSDATASRPLKRPKKGDITEGGEKIEISQGKECQTTSQTKSRGTPPKLLVDSQKSSVASFQDASIGEIAVVSETDCGRERPIMAITKISYDVTGDHQPLRLGSEGIYSSTKLDDSNGTINQWNGARESNVELAQIDFTNNSVPCLNQKLPFVKSSRIWEVVDSMEVFQTMQQNPHFHPLYSFKEEFREGLAIGTMVTFANLLEKTCKLQLDDPRSIWVRYLEVLPDLETHGFDVQVLRDRLNELLAIKNRQEQNLDELNHRELRLLEKVNKNSKIDEEIDKLNEKIREFEEKRASAMSIKKIQDSEIVRLQQRTDDTREGMRSTQLDFERIID